MADIEAIRRGLAANLRTVEDCVVSPWLIDNITKAALSVAGPERAAYFEGAFGQLASDRGANVPFVIEGAVSCAGGLRAGQMLFDQWILWEVPEAIEADTRLTSRLQNNGSILTDQDPACDSLAVREFRGYRRTTLPNGSDVLLGDWVVELIAGG